MRQLNIYTDGSYSKADPENTYGGFYCEGICLNQSVKTSVPEATAMWNVGGELLAALTVIKMVASMAEALEKENESLNVNIIYDYEGVGKWCSGEWKAKKTMTIAYRDYVRKVRRLR